MDRPQVVVIANPVAGPAWRRRSPAAIAARIDALLARHDVAGRVELTLGPGHAKSLASDAVADGADLVVAWGGDGTINEVASALVRTGTALGIVPVGSGNGLAREVGVPRAHGAALAWAITGTDRVIDAGELNGRVFFNAAGVGFDAHVAAVFAASAGHIRGFSAYAAATLRELFRYNAGTFVVEADGLPSRTRRALLISVANTRQWGSGARIAPAALMDDERLDLVVVPARPPTIVLANMWRLFAGSVPGWSAVESVKVHAAVITASPPAAVHVDGEPLGRLSRIELRVVPAALRVRAHRSR